MHPRLLQRICLRGLAPAVAAVFIMAAPASASIFYDLNTSAFNNSATGNKTISGVQLNLAAAHDPAVTNRLTHLRGSSGGVGIDTREISPAGPSFDGHGIDNTAGSEVMTLTFSTDVWLLNLEMGSLELRNGVGRAHDVLLVQFTDAGVAKSYDYSSEHVTLTSGTVGSSTDGTALIDFTALNAAGIYVPQGTTITLRQATNNNLLVGSTANQPSSGNGITIQNLTASTTPVPEPASLMLIGAAGAMLMVRRRTARG